MTGAVCPQCGNIIQEWSHGVCYRCVQIEKDRKRYGHRRPVRRRQPRANKTQAQPTQQKQARRRKRARQAPATPAPPSKTAARSTPSVQVSNMGSLRRGINRFLSAVYGSKRYLSQILREGGLRQAEVDRLKQHLLHSFIVRVVQGWCYWLEQTLPKKLSWLLIRMYGLDGKPALSIAEISAVQGLSEPEGLRRWQEAIGRLRQQGGQPLENTVLVAARQALG